ncbi:hypothetical protein F4801DRAFT_569253 [Xylaria longipes]|nr:hypothetical protein F4801DRAFT_569253 [Xylaria longipes]
MAGRMMIAPTSLRAVQDCLFLPSRRETESLEFRIGERFSIMSQRGRQYVSSSLAPSPLINTLNRYLDCGHSKTELIVVTGQTTSIHKSGWSGECYDRRAVQHSKTLSFVSAPPLSDRKTSLKGRSLILILILVLINETLLECMVLGPNLNLEAMLHIATR